MTLEADFTPTTTGTGSSQLQVFVSRVENTTRAVVAGELDGATAVSLSEQLHQVIAELVGDLVIDVGLLTFIDSTGLAMLLSLHKEVAESGHALTVADPTPMARRLLRITGVDRVVTIEPPH